MMHDLERKFPPLLRTQSFYSLETLEVSWFYYDDDDDDDDD